MNPYEESLKQSSSKFAVFLRDAKLDPRRVLSVSHEIEQLRNEDRVVKRAKKNAAGKEDDAAKTARAAKPRSGRKVTAPLMRAAIDGSEISGPAKTRILRAVNALLAAKKKPEANLKSLF